MVGTAQVRLCPPYGSGALGDIVRIQRHDGILAMHGPTKDAAFPCLIVIGFHLNPV